MSVLRKLKNLVTGERVDLQTGEVIELERRHEFPSNVPIAPPVNYKREPSLMEKIQMMVLKDKVQRLQEELGAESPEEAEDFDIGEPDDFQPSSPHEFERHEYELLEAMEKLQNKQAAWEAKYGKPGGAGAKAPAEAPGAAPKPPEEASGGDQPPLQVP